MLRDLTYGIVKFWSSSDLCAHLHETSRAAGTAMELCRRLREHCVRLGAIFSQQWFLHNHKAFHHIIFVFVTVTRFATSKCGIHYVSLCIHIHTANLAADGSRAIVEEHLDTHIERT